MAPAVIYLSIAWRSLLTHARGTARLSPLGGTNITAQLSQEFHGPHCCTLSMNKWPFEVAGKVRKLSIGECFHSSSMTIRFAGLVAWTYKRSNSGPSRPTRSSWYGRTRTDFWEVDNSMVAPAAAWRCYSKGEIREWEFSQVTHIDSGEDNCG